MKTSTLPVVTVVTAKDNAALRRQLDDPLVDPSGFRVIGDRGLYIDLFGKELTDTSNPKQYSHHAPAYRRQELAP